MLQAYFDRNMRADAVFEFFVRRMPDERSFLVAAGLEQAVGYLRSLHFEQSEIEALRTTGLFADAFLDYLSELRFNGDADAMPEGTVFFPNEPIFRILASLPEAQLVESRIVNILHFQTLIASKAARCVLTAPNSTLVDFGMRRAHGSEAAILAARASYLAGFAGTATTIAKPLFDIPIFGTMAHSFIQAHDTESEAFAHFVESHRGTVVLLIDTFDTETGARRVVDLARKLPPGTIHSVRLDSGNLSDLAKRVRAILDEAGFGDIGIFASGGIDEYALQEFARANAPIDGYGIGTSLDVSTDCPALDCVYKLQEYAGIARRKRSTGKATWPGRKQVYRVYDGNGKLHKDILTTSEDVQPGEPLLQPVLRSGELTGPLPGLSEIRQHVRIELERLPDALRALRERPDYVPIVSSALRTLADQVDRRFA
jgi:nicotinate phosphoribosyltransferase